MGVKKSVVATRARSSLSRNTAASSRVAASTSTRGVHHAWQVAQDLREIHRAELAGAPRTVRERGQSYLGFGRGRRPPCPVGRSVVLIVAGKSNLADGGTPAPARSSRPTGSRGGRSMPAPAAPSRRIRRPRADARPVPGTARRTTSRAAGTSAAINASSVAKKSALAQLRRPLVRGDQVHHRRDRHLGGAAQPPASACSPATITSGAKNPVQLVHWRRAGAGSRDGAPRRLVGGARAEGQPGPQH